VKTTNFAGQGHSGVEKLGGKKKLEKNGVVGFPKTNSSVLD